MLTYEELLKERDEIIERLKSENASFRETIFRMAEKEIFVNKLLLVNEEVDKYKAWKEAEEQGLLLKLPCKVGDTIYRIGTMCDFNEIPSEFNCDCVDCEECFYGTKLVIREGSAKEFHIRRFMDGTSKYDFLTKAEAEKVLAEMEKWRSRDE